MATEINQIKILKKISFFVYPRIFCCHGNFTEIRKNGITAHPTFSLCVFILFFSSSFSSFSALFSYIYSVKSIQVSSPHFFITFFSYHYYPSFCLPFYPPSPFFVLTCCHDCRLLTYFITLLNYKSILFTYFPPNSLQLLTMRNFF